jgi:aminocarboxymuconate-semialdehyde decarboxylase
MRIDVFAHILTSKYVDAVDKLTQQGPFVQRILEESPTLSDLDYRFRIMDKYDEYLQVLTHTHFGRVSGEAKAADLARIANDEMAELVSKYPDRFAAAVACLPVNSVDAALKEMDRAINELRFRGIQLWTPINGKPMDLPEFIPLYEKMSRYDLPIWIHPTRGPDIADYIGENASKYRIYQTFGWPYETTIAMARLVFSGVLQQFPNLKFITHHCGAMVPYFAHRIISHCNANEMRRKETYTRGLTRHPIEYFRMFYNDTAVNGSTPALMCGYAFFGAEQLLFGTDMPFDSRNGDESISETILSIEEMDIPDSDKKKIFEDNARKLMRLPV